MEGLTHILHGCNGEIYIVYCTGGCVIRSILHLKVWYMVHIALVWFMVHIALVCVVYGTYCTGVWCILHIALACVVYGTYCTGGCGI